MSFDQQLFAAKIRQYREQFQLSVAELASRCGIAVEGIEALERRRAAGTGGRPFCDGEYLVNRGPDNKRG